LRGRRRQPGIKIAVKDNGCGIAEERVKLLFEPFMQVDNSLTRKRDGRAWASPSPDVSRACSGAI